MSGEGLGGIMVVRLALTIGAGVTTAIGAGLTEKSSGSAYDVAQANIVAWGLVLGVLHRALKGPAGNWGIFPVIAFSLMFFMTGGYVHNAVVEDEKSPQTDETEQKAGGYALLAIGMWAAWLACAPLDFVSKIKDAFGSSKEFIWSIVACMPVAGIVVGCIILWDQYDSNTKRGMYEADDYMALVFYPAYVAMLYIHAHFGRNQCASFLVMITGGYCQYFLLSLPANDDKYGDEYAYNNAAGTGTTDESKTGAVIAWASVLGACLLTYMRVPGLTLQESFAKTKSNLMGPRFYVLGLCLAATIIGTIISADIYDKSWISVNSIAVVSIIIMSRFNEGTQRETFLAFSVGLFVAIQDTLVREITFQDRGARDTSDAIIRAADETKLAGCLLMVIGMYASWAVLFPIEKINEVITRIKKIGNLIVLFGLVCLTVGVIILTWFTRHTTPYANGTFVETVAAYWVFIVIIFTCVFCSADGFTYVVAAFFTAFAQYQAFAYARLFDSGSPSASILSHPDEAAAGFYIYFGGCIFVLLGLGIEWPAELYTDLKDVKSPSQMQV